MKILGLDVGEKRIGMAMADEKLKVVFPRETILVKNQRQVFVFLKKFCVKEGISRIVVGLPLNEDDGETKQSKKIRVFGKKLEAAIKIPLVFQEESFSTKEAMWKMPKDRKEYRDSIAAMVILERYFKEFPSETDFDQ